MEKRKYGITAVSLWPWSLGSRGPERSIKMAMDAGYDGIQAIPIKGWSYEKVDDWGKYVISFEDAWNTGPLWKAILREIGLMKEPAPRMVDWLLFGKVLTYHYPNAIESLHHPDPKQKGVLEMYPDLWNDPQKYIDYANQGGSLCWDTWHIRRPIRGTVEPEPLGDWRKLLKALPGGSIKLIHVHPIQMEIREFLAGEFNELAQMLLALSYKTNAPAIVEVFPPLKTPQGTIKHLAKILEVTKKWLD
jgi:hypothetical protein